MVIWTYAAFLAFSIGAPAPVIPVSPIVPVVSPMPRPEQILMLPPELRRQLREQVIDLGGSKKTRLERLGHFMFQKSGLGMEYSVDATLTVEQAYRTRKANCLTFTLLTVALAREAGLEAYGQELADVVAWRADDSIVFRFNHVNAGISIGHRRFTLDVARDQVLSRDPPERISDDHLLALYYNNRAAELLAGASPTAAIPYMNMALQLAPHYAGAWANAGVLHMRQHDPEAAERDYLQALSLDPKNGGALVNLVALYHDNGDEVSRAIYAQRLEEIKAKDPYLQFMQAVEDERKGNYTGAVQLYRRAIDLYDGDSRFYVGLARVYRQLGEERHAQRAMDRAITLNPDSANDDDPGRGQ